MRAIFIHFILLLINAFVSAQQPSLQWAKQVGGVYDDNVTATTLDKDGNIYMIGKFSRTANFDPGPDSFNITSLQGGDDLFMLKLDMDGKFLWAKNIGEDVNGNTIATDALGNVYVSGSFSGRPDFNPGTGFFFLNGTSCAFILKLDASGNFIWVKKVGGVANGASILTDIFGNVYIAGSYSWGGDFDPGLGVFELDGAQNMFILKLDASGNLVWVKSIKSDMYAYGCSLAIDVFGNLIATGIFSGTIDCNPDSAIVYNLTTFSDLSMFILKLDTTGNFIWAKKIEGTAINPADMKLDSTGNIYCTGSFSGQVDFDPGIGRFDVSSAGANDIFILKLSNEGDFIWVKSFGSWRNDLGRSIYLDGNANIYALGSFSGQVDFDPGDSTYFLISKTSIIDMYLLKLDSSGQFVWAEGMSVSQSCIDGNSVVVDLTGNIYTTGTFCTTVDFNPNRVDVANLTSKGGTDVFIQKFSQSSTGINKLLPATTLTIYPNPTSGIFNLAIPQASTNCVVEVYNNLGALILQQTATNEIIAINLSSQPGGMYFVKVSNREGVSVGKVGKE